MNHQKQEVNKNLQFHILTKEILLEKESGFGEIIILNTLTDMSFDQSMNFQLRLKSVNKQQVNQAFKISREDLKLKEVKLKIKLIDFMESERNMTCWVVENTSYELQSQESFIDIKVKNELEIQ